MNSGVRQNKRGAHSRGYGDKVALEVCATSQLRLKCRDNMMILDVRTTVRVGDRLITPR